MSKLSTSIRLDAMQQLLTGASFAVLNASSFYRYKYAGRIDFIRHLAGQLPANGKDDPFRVIYRGRFGELLTGASTDTQRAAMRFQTNPDG